MTGGYPVQKNADFSVSLDGRNIVHLVFQGRCFPPCVPPDAKLSISTRHLVVKACGESRSDSRARHRATDFV